MKEINNLTYTLEINYTNNSGLDTSIAVKFNDNGLNIKTTKIENVCITEETINGRVLSGRIDNLEGYCGYKYDYKNGENLLNINPNIPVNTAISLINKKKMESDFISAQLVLSSIIRNDYRVVILNEGNLNITKTISAENENAEHCYLQEHTNLLKLKGQDRFIEQNKKRIYTINDDCEIEESETLVDSDKKLYLNKLTEIIAQNPQNYKELIEFKKEFQKNIINNSQDENNTM